MKKQRIAVVGLGYVGLPVAVEFEKDYPVLGLDISEARINELYNGYDRTNEVTTEALKQGKITFTSDAKKLADYSFIIVAVPTPIDESNQPDLTALRKASEMVGRNMAKGSIVVYESTVYPGATEEVCIPVLEESSGMKEGREFFVGYSPERINPGDKVHTFRNIRKIVSSNQPAILEKIADIYGSVIDAGVHKVDSIKVAEAAKVIENTQRDLNIGLMNELSMLFSILDIDTKEVLKAAGTKWNFLNFSPGLVGGHCIGVDPYYLTHKAESVGYTPKIILAGRQVNDSVSKFIVADVVKEMIRQGIDLTEAKLTVLGLTFKENVPDLRNSKVFDIIEELQQYGLTIQVADPRADSDEAIRDYGITLMPYSELQPADLVILAVAHDEFKEVLPKKNYFITRRRPALFVDLKRMFQEKDLPENANYWGL
ncbi:nucleotide sugar dehydrogenase [Listeria booriae]|uniref:Nucleotide sugar dehydrogenase n=1 Tax=Listeria booriae TaxID=1552123 RepID=A0A7X0XIA2_9LIST|nr:nucleotide sugar dehydrogenase [Listeria booriae]MBC1561550.1 nucleotide sugar dehydrogenase [Listeria booriae]MBC1574021.1 nucleotide sugar dehydrogenase [Listeria booriae]MBC2321745.1 nucleotide sugar dehydrogenase [Listeria booriae]MCD2205764.1 nucleotide sugar dehydrogenase [Listeria booriae]